MQVVSRDPNNSVNLINYDWSNIVSVRIPTGMDLKARSINRNSDRGSSAVFNKSLGCALCFKLNKTLVLVLFIK